jgi:hypothetical protein
MLDLIHPDDIPSLSEKEKQMPDLIIVDRGWVFRFAYGYLWWAYPH